MAMGKRRTGRAMFKPFLGLFALTGSCVCFRGLDSLFLCDKTHPAHKLRMRRPTRPGDRCPHHLTVKSLSRGRG